MVALPLALCLPARGFRDSNPNRLGSQPRALLLVMLDPHVEQQMGFEPMTFSLATRHSTTELLLLIPVLRPGWLAQIYKATRTHTASEDDRDRTGDRLRDREECKPLHHTFVPRFSIPGTA